MKLVIRLYSVISLVIVTIALSGLLVSKVYSGDCLFDSNNNGVADAGIDTDEGANSGDMNDNFACEKNSQAIGSFATAIGSTSIC